MSETQVELARLIRECRAQTGRPLTIGAVESATGGRIADRLTAVPGSSEYFRGSVVAYSDYLKIALIGVREATIRDHGAVSEQTAIEMAQGGRGLLGVDICVSDTGIAGPDGGTAQKPVGLFCFGLAAEDVCMTEVRVFSGDREANKQAAAETALEMVSQYLSTYIGHSRSPL